MGHLAPVLLSALSKTENVQKKLDNVRYAGYDKPALLEDEKAQKLRRSFFFVKNPCKV